ncbi:hypothetical protein [Kineosporia sp. R_H_3]|uniref:hypothetical protein n=1 Tax=Kineosporia sp. R_H_3 TaxID=1961848 RepID=UPI000B4AC46B|nr:hypothetical protein [Kineosporia sp. R_H_3]
MSALNDRPWTRWVSCQCGKRGYLTRKIAKAMARQMRNGMSEYQCKVSEKWHIGHLPPEVTRGAVPRQDVGGPDTRRLPEDYLQRPLRRGEGAA